MTQEFGCRFVSFTSVMSSKISVTDLQGFFMEEQNWLKSKAYLHITGQLDVVKKREQLIRKVTNKNYVAKYSFFPLIHSVIHERKYKKNKLTNRRAHSFINSKGEIEKGKSRPLHYASNMDALIYGYYAEQLQAKYDAELKLNNLHESVIAYRKIPTEIPGKYKSTIHFANEIFQSIKERVDKDGSCIVLAFDIKSFFSRIDHKLLKIDWQLLMNESKLSDDEYNVFKGATRFSYILRDELRKHQSLKGKRSGFNEKELAQIRNNFGINAYFSSPQDFREKKKSGFFKIYKFPFRNKKGDPIGIPQGLPISAVLANLYLLSFDKEIQEKLVSLGCYYRRYSDDIAILCKPGEIELVEKCVNGAIKLRELNLSEDKTEKFIFSKSLTSEINCKKIDSDLKLKNGSFTYLGFEFNGKNVLIKSANLSKFYRRMISAVKRKANRAKKIAANRNNKKIIIYRRQLYKLYSALDLNKVKVHKRWKRIVKTELGTFRLKTGIKKKQLKSNYFSYASRASDIMQEPKIYAQVRNHKKIFNQAIQKHLRRAL